MPKISVVLPVYNGEKYLKESIDSILNQTFSDFEFIIVNDGSTDKTEEIIESYNDGRIKYFKKENSGIVDSLNYGIEKSNTDLIVRMDADDISNPSRLQKLLNFMENNGEVDICGSWAEKINENGDQKGVLNYPPIKDKEIRKYAYLHNPFIHPSVIFRKKIFDDVGGYKNFKHVEDYELWIRLLQKGIGHNIPECLIKYRIHGNQITRKNNLKMKLTGIYIRFLALIKL